MTFVFGVKFQTDVSAFPDSHIDFGAMNVAAAAALSMVLVRKTRSEQVYGASEEYKTQKEHTMSSVVYPVGQVKTTWTSKPFMSPGSILGSGASCQEAPWGRPRTHSCIALCRTIRAI